VTPVYEEIVEFIAASNPERVAEFSVSPTAKERVADLIAREKTVGLSDDETDELDCYVQLEHIMRLAKARASRQIGA